MRQWRVGHFVDAGHAAGGDRAHQDRRSRIGRIVDPERAVSIAAVKGRDPSRRDRQDAVRAGDRRCRLLPGKSGRPAEKCQAGSRKDINAGIGSVGNEDVSGHRVGEADVE
jgi:hypothetical protein